MKNFKKYILSFLAITTFTLTSCNNQADTTDKENTTVEAPAETPETTDIKITINDKVNDKEVLTEDAAIGEDGLEKYLEKNHKAVFKDGMMTELEGISQDESANQYWMYYVNDEMADVGIGDYVPKDGDKIEFRFEQM